MSTAPPRLRVPYVTAYSGEHIEYRLALAAHPEATDGRRLSYVDAADSDYMFGALWHRHGVTRTGHPEWKLVNTQRQRRCMLHNLCQVCGGPATDADGWIWWVMADEPTTTTTGERTTNAPPTCLGCIPEARMLCPRLRRESQVFRARDAVPYGVIGEIYQPVGSNLIAAGQAEVPLDAFWRLDYTIAKQLLVALDGLERRDLPAP